MHILQKRTTLCMMTSLPGRPMTVRERRRLAQVDGGSGSLSRLDSADECELFTASKGSCFFRGKQTRQHE